MAAFTYSAINAQGLELRGELHAPDIAAATEQLRARGLLPKRLTQAKGCCRRGPWLQEGLGEVAAGLSRASSRR
jgi:type II secretory pathway component PulF